MRGPREKKGKRSRRDGGGGIPTAPARRRDDGPGREEDPSRAMGVESTRDHFVAQCIRRFSRWTDVGARPRCAPTSPMQRRTKCRSVACVFCVSVATADPAHGSVARGNLSDWDYGTLSGHLDNLPPFATIVPRSAIVLVAGRDTCDSARPLVTRRSFVLYLFLFVGPIARALVYERR